jgi:predicted N-acetyltransferase YhbS
MELSLRQAGPDDLPAINRVVEAAFMTWDLPERVKRLSLPSYRYDEMDLRHLDLVLAERGGEVVGVAAWEPAEAVDCPDGKRGLLLHGLYVHPHSMRRGVGAHLLLAVRKAAAAQGFDGVLVKAQKDSLGFFERQGLRALPVEDAARHYAKRLWLQV